MVKASWNGAIIAESSSTETVEGNHYFPPQAVKEEFLEQSNHTSTCPWKGEASYYHVVVNGEENENAAWTYKNPKPEAQNIKGYIAFWHGVKVE